MVTNTAPSTASTTLTFNEGADGLGDVVFVGTDDTVAMDADGNDLSAGGDPVYLTGYGTSTLTGYVDENLNGTYDPGTDTVVLTVQVDPSGNQWFAQIDVDLDNGSATNFDLVGGISGGNNDHQAIGADDSTNNTDNVDLIVEGSPGSVNTSNGRIGVGGGQSISAGEVVKIEFVINAVTSPDGADLTGFDWDSTFGTEVFRQDVNRISGPQSNGANFTVSAWDTDGDDDIIGDPDDVMVTITNVLILNQADTSVFDITGGVNTGSSVVNPDTSVTYSFTVNEGSETHNLTVTTNVDGSISITGIPEGWEYQIESADGDPFEGVSIEGDTGGSNFTLGALTIGEESTGDPFDMEFDISGTDGDGDAISGNLTLTVEPPVEAAAAPSPAVLSSSSLTGSVDGSLAEDLVTLDGTYFFDAGSEENNLGGVFDDLFVMAEDTGGRDLLSGMPERIEAGLMDHLQSFGGAMQTTYDHNVSGFDKSSAPVVSDLQIHPDVLPYLPEGIEAATESTISSGMNLSDMLDLGEFDLGMLLDSEQVAEFGSLIPTETTGWTLGGSVTSAPFSDEIHLLYAE